jgi:hypothetical protein
MIISRPSELNAGGLTPATPHSSVVIELRRTSASTSQLGYSNGEMIPELHKLGVAPGQRILLRHAPKAFLEELRARLPSGVRLTTRNAARASYDLIFEWLAPGEDLEAFFSQLQHWLQPDGALWVVIPNQREAKRRGAHYDWNAIVAAALRTTLVDNKTLSFSSEEYGTRFVIRRIFRSQAL